MVSPQQDKEFQVLVEACRLAEKNVENEIVIALAADQRATNFAGLMVASIAILIGMGGNIGSNIWLILSIVSLTIAAILSGAAARSVKVYHSGFKFEDFNEDITQERSMKDVLRDIGAHYDKGSEHNREIIRKNSKLFKNALWISAIGLFFAIVSILLADSEAQGLP